MEKRKVKFKYRIEYGFVAALDGFFRVLPYCACISFARNLAWFAFHILRWRRAEAERRIKTVLHVDDRQSSKIAYQSLKCSALTAAEIMYGRTIRESWIMKHTEGGREAAEAFRKISESGHGAVLALPHFGNWYLAGSVVAHYGVNLSAVAGLQHNPLTNDWMNRRLYGGMTVFERGSSAIRQCVKCLRSRGVLAILPDVRMKHKDLTVHFLGGEANLGRGMATFARKTGSPIVLAKLGRKDDTHHVINVAEPIYPDMSLDDDADVLRMTELVMSLIDAQIRADPGQWFWYNKRWVLDPIGEEKTTEGQQS